MNQFYLFSGSSIVGNMEKENLCIIFMLDEATQKGFQTLKPLKMHLTLQIFDSTTIQSAASTIT